LRVARFYSTSGGANFGDLSHLGVMGHRPSNHAAMTVTRGVGFGSLADIEIMGQGCPLCP
jgi:hypothetical protein